MKLRIIDLFFPQKCVICNDVTINSVPVCNECYPEFLKILTSKCPSCGMPHNLCRCSGDDRFLFFYHDKGKQIIRSIKYYNDRHFSDFFGDLIYETVCQDLPYDCIVFPPRSRKNIAKYGFDQMKVISSRVAYNLNIPVCDAIYRTKKSAEQKLLSASQRKLNTKNLFKADQEKLKNYKRVLLLDDVRTTGSTVTECKKALKKAGIESVTVVTIAKTPKKSFLKASKTYLKGKRYKQNH